MNPYQEFIYKRTYARWLEPEQRREHYSESVKRYGDYLRPRVPEELLEEYNDVINGILNMEAMPSMRAFWTAGKALDRDNITAYNCAYTVIDRVKALPEILYILMCGTGVGFSTERKYIEQLPVVPKKFTKRNSERNIVVGDSRQGWAEAYETLLDLLYRGILPTVDYSQIRPEGARLKTFGGRASGSKPLEELFKFTIKTFKNARGRKLKSIEVYDLVTMVASIVIAGGVRRSATINLSDLDDLDMKTAKQGEFWVTHPNRSLSNNSAVYNKKPTQKELLDEWANLVSSGTGERGIVNREGIQRQMAMLGRDPNIDYGVNPCGEVILQPEQFCNLTEAIIRKDDDLDTILKNVRYATILGVLQTTLTDFKYIDKRWKENVEAERLLGTSLTGLKDHKVLKEVSSEARWYLREMRKEAVQTARRWSEALGIETPLAITSVKPSGTVSQLVDSSSGIHPRHAEYFIRRVRVAKTDPVTQMLIDYEIPHHPEAGYTMENTNTIVFEFPIKSPEGAVLKGSETAIEQLEYWKMIKTYWTHHNPSQTISVKDDEWIEVLSWVERNFNLIAGLSFLEYDGGVYDLAPYETISRREYLELKAKIPEINWEDLGFYETTDQTEGSREFACVGGSCEI